MSLTSFIIGLSASVGVLLLFAAIHPRHVTMTEFIAPYLGVPIRKPTNGKVLADRIHSLLVNGKSAPWASDQRVLAELRKCSSNQSLIGFRYEQLIFGSIATGLVSGWIVLKLLTGHLVNPIFGMILLPIAFVGGGGFRSWLLKETSRTRLKNIEAELPAILDLLAFAVSAGEPVITAMQRVSETCTGELSEEIKRLIAGLKVGDNFLISLDRIQRELGSQSVSRAFRALVMAIERGTPIADVLRAQAMDARNLEARKLVTMAGKKETLMMIPVVFLILPMIVIVALYPGLIALKGF